jgi:glycosyltransferase involved in cell wall biosynthesis
MSSASLAVLIATRNRPQNLLRAMKSIAASEPQPAVVIVVSSGDNVSEFINSMQWPFILVHEHVQGYGQIRQKQKGIDLLPEYIEWVLFMDDDIQLDSKAIFNALALKQNFPEPILGIGFGAVSVKKQSVLKSFTSRKNLGKVTSDGRNLDYASSRRVIPTDWLNGISMWNRSILHKYDFPYLDSKYSICEDLIFSYSVSRLGRIVFEPLCQFSFQFDEPKLVNSFDAFRANAYWRTFFVLSNSNLSRFRFLAVQLYRTLKFLLLPYGGLGMRKDVCLIYFDILGITLKNSDPISMLITRQV